MNVELMMMMMDENVVRWCHESVELHVTCIINEQLANLNASRLGILLATE